MDILALVNAPIFWILCAVLVIWVMVQSALYIRLSYKQAVVIGYDTKNLTSAVKNGAIAAVGPAMAGFAVMISMMAVIGGPVTWQRLSIIGAPATELTAATIGAGTLGQAIGPGIGLDGVAMAFLIMAINGCGWLIICTIFTARLDTLRVKLSGGDTAWLALLGAAASIGLFGNFAAVRLLMGVDNMAGTAVAFATQFTVDKYVAPKAQWIKGYTLSIALALGIISAAIVGANL